MLCDDDNLLHITIAELNNVGNEVVSIAESNSQRIRDFSSEMRHIELYTSATMEARLRDLYSALSALKYPVKIDALTPVKVHLSNLLHGLRTSV